MKSKKVPAQKHTPMQNISNGNKMNDGHKREVVKKVKPPIIDTIYTDYMETLRGQIF